MVFFDGVWVEPQNRKSHEAWSDGFNLFQIAGLENLSSSHGVVEVLASRGATKRCSRNIPWNNSRRMRMVKKLWFQEKTPRLMVDGFKIV